MAKFTERNSWEGETWVMLVRPIDENDEELSEQFAEAWNRDTWKHPSAYKVAVVETTIDEANVMEESATMGYYNSFEWMDFSERLRETLPKLIGIIDRGEAKDIDWDEYLYKLRLFFDE